MKSVFTMMQSDEERMLEIERNIEQEEIEKKRLFKLEVDSIEHVVAKKKRFYFTPESDTIPNYTFSDKLASYLKREYPDEALELIKAYEELKTQGDDTTIEEFDEYVMYMINFLFVKLFPKERNTCAFPHEINFSFTNFKLRNKTNAASKDKYGASVLSMITTEDKNPRFACSVLRGTLTTAIRSTYKYRSIILDMLPLYKIPLENLRNAGSRAFDIQYNLKYVARCLEDIQLVINRQENPIFIFDGDNVNTNGQLVDGLNYYFITKIYEINCNPNDELNMNFVNLKGIVNFALLID